jgi:transcriptional regulator with XRE-family HTH domain
MPRKTGRPAGYKPDGPEIRRLRVEVHGLSAAQLGARAGITEDVVWKAERSQPVMDVNAVRLAKALGVEVEDIASPPGDDTESEPEPKALAS